MEFFLKQIKVYAVNFLSQHEYFIWGDYYSGLFKKYFSVAGFIVGFILVLLIYFSSAEGQRKAGFFKVLSFIAVINSCSIISEYVDSLFAMNSEYHTVSYSFSAADNIFSGFILILVISSCYRGYGGRAFLFGLATYAVIPLLHYELIRYIDWTEILALLVRMLTMGILCTIVSNRKYFFTGWIWYIGIRMALKLATYLLSTFLHSGSIEFITVNYLLSYLRFFIVDYIVFIVVLVFAVVFERMVLPEGRKAPTP